MLKKGFIIFNVQHNNKVMCKLEDFFFPANGINGFGGSEFVFSLILSKQGGVLHTVGLAIYIKKYLKANEEFWKLK
jgi:hypothetical protein